MENFKAFNWKRIRTIAESMPFYWYVPTVYAIIFVIGIPLEYLTNLLHIPDKEITSQVIPDSFFLKILLVVTVVPFLETFLTQALPYYFLSLFQFMKRNQWLIILISGILFGSFHIFSLQHIIYGTIIGFFLSGTYVVRAKKGDSFLCTYLLHAFFNLVAILISQFS